MLDKAQEQRAIRMYAKGIAPSAIAKEVGVSLYTLNVWRGSPAFSACYRQYQREQDEEITSRSRDLRHEAAEVLVLTIDAIRDRLGQPSMLTATDLCNLSRELRSLLVEADKMTGRKPPEPEPEGPAIDPETSANELAAIVRQYRNPQEGPQRAR